MAEKVKIKITFYDAWKWYEIQISGFINKVLLEHSHSICLHMAFGCFGTTRERWIAAADNIWSTEPKNIFTPWPFTRSLAHIPIQGHWCALPELTRRVTHRWCGCIVLESVSHSNMEYPSPPPHTHHRRWKFKPGTLCTSECSWCSYGPAEGFAEV